MEELGGGGVWRGGKGKGKGYFWLGWIGLLLGFGGLVGRIYGEERWLYVRCGY